MIFFENKTLSSNYKIQSTKSEQIRGMYLKVLANFE